MGDGAKRIPVRSFRAGITMSYLSIGERRLNTREYLQQHFSWVVKPALTLLFAVALLPAVFYRDEREDRVTKTAHLASINYVEGETSTDNRYTLYFAEFPKGIEVTHLQPGDQYLLTSVEKPGNLFTIVMERAKWEKGGSYGMVPALELSSSTNVYVQPDPTTNLMRKARWAAFLGFLTFFSIAAWSLRKMLKHKKEAKKTAEPTFDPWLIFIVQNPLQADLLLFIYLGYVLWAVLPTSWLAGGWLTLLIAAVGAAVWSWKFFPKLKFHEQVQQVLLKERAKLPQHVQTTAPKHVKAVELLVKSKRLDAHNEEGLTPLHIAAEVGSTETISLLIRSGASISVTDEKSRSALHAAVEKNQLPAVRLLLELGADPLAMDGEGNLPLGVAEAQKKKNEPMIDALKKATDAAEKKKKADAEKAAAEAAKAAAAAQSSGAPATSPPASAEPAKEGSGEDPDSDSGSATG